MKTTDTKKYSVVAVYPNLKAPERKVADAVSYNHAMNIADDLNRNGCGSVYVRHEVRAKA